MRYEHTQSAPLYLLLLALGGGLVGGASGRGVAVRSVRSFDLP